MVDRTSCRVPRTTHLSPRKLNIPGLEVVVAINASVRHDDEWFDDVDDLDRIEKILTDLQAESDSLIAAAIATSRIATAQAFSEGNKRTALLVGRWILDRNDLSGSRFMPSDDRELANPLLKAARGEEISGHVIALFDSRR